MAPRVAKNVEILFILLVIGIFFVVCGKYFGSEIQAGLSRVTDRARVYLLYRHYEKMAEDIEVPERGNESENLVPVLVYHGIVPGKPKNEEEVSLADFTDQMYTLKKEGYQTVSMDQFYRFATQGESLPDKSFVLTFDDGRKDSYYPVDPILKALGYTATMFVITNTLNHPTLSPYYLSTEELRTMAHSGRWELQSHGRDDHVLIPVNATGGKGRFMSNKKWLASENRLETDVEYKDRLVADLQVAKQDLQEIFGVASIAYALPFGDYGHNTTNASDAEEVIQAVLRETYPVSFFQANREVRTGYFRANYYDPHDVQYFFRRIKVLDFYDASQLLDVIRASHEKTLPHKNDFSNVSDWILAWGKFNILEDQAILQNSNGNNSGAIFLDGSELWQDYRFDVTAQLTEGNNYNLFARVKNGKSYVGCGFEQDEIKAFVVEDESYRMLSRLSVNAIGIEKQQTGSIEVRGNQVRCLFNGKIKVQSTIPKGHEMGGVGIGAFSIVKDTPAVMKIAKQVVVTSAEATKK